MLKSHPSSHNAVDQLDIGTVDGIMFNLIILESVIHQITELEAVAVAVYDIEGDYGYGEGQEGYQRDEHIG